MKKITALCMSSILLSVAGCTLQKGNSDLSNNHALAAMRYGVGIFDNISIGVWTEIQEGFP